MIKIVTDHECFFFSLFSYSRVRHRGPCPTVCNPPPRHWHHILHQQEDLRSVLWSGVEQEPTVHSRELAGFRTLMKRPDSCTGTIFTRVNHVGTSNGCTVHHTYRILHSQSPESRTRGPTAYSFVKLRLEDSSMA